MAQNATAQGAQKEKKATALQVVIPNTEANKPQEKTQLEIKPISLEDIKRKNEVLTRLVERYDTIQEKKKSLENFSYSYDRDTAFITVKDAKGEIFQSNSPKTIGQVIEFWKAEFSKVAQEVEREIRELA